MSRSGFTLIELMLTVLVLAIVMSLFYGVVVSTAQAAQRVEEIMQGAEIGPAILAQIREDLEGVVLLDPKAEQFVGIDRKFHTGDRDRIDFLTSTMTFDREKEELDPKFYSLNEVGYQVQENPRDSSLGILYRRLDPFVDANPLKEGRLVEMYDRVRSFDVVYIEDPQKVLPETSWNNKQKDGKLPKAVRVTLVIAVSARGGQATEDRHYTMTVTRVE